MGLKNGDVRIDIGYLSLDACFGSVAAIIIQPLFDFRITPLAQPSIESKTGS